MWEYWIIMLFMSKMFLIMLFRPTLIDLNSERFVLLAINVIILLLIRIRHEYLTRYYKISKLVGV